MYSFAYVLSRVILYALTAMEILVVARALISIVPSDDENRFFDFIYAVTDPVVVPASMLLDRFEFTRSMPFDFSCLLTIIILSVIQFLLPTV